MLPQLTILTTADASADVMHAFADRLAGLGLQLSLSWQVVDGLHAYPGSHSLWAQPPRFLTQWIRPEAPLPQLAAVMLGLHQIQGPVVVMDPDMADNLPDLAQFWQAHAAGADIVFGWRIQRRGISRTRQWLSTLFNRLASRLLDLPVHDLNTPMISFTAEALQCLLHAPPDCPSPRLYTYDKARRRLGEVPIEVQEPQRKKSAYTHRRRLLTGVVRLRELVAFQRYRYRA